MRANGASTFLRAALAAAALAIAVIPTAARAADPLPIDPATDRAVAQLEGVQLPDGGFGQRLAVRDTATVGEALRLARPASPAIIRLDAYLAPLTLDDVDSLARVALGAPGAANAAALRAQQNDDGGFGLSRDYQSDALDTALALRALTAANEREAAQRAVSRLLKFGIAGAWGGESGDVALTAEAVLALDGYIRRYGSTSAIDAALTGAYAWLRGAQQADGSFTPGELSVRNTTLAVAALATSPAAIDAVVNGTTSLLNGQQPDGSWGDPFTTALAIRALHRAGEAIERDRVTQLPDPGVHARDLSANPQTVEPGKPITIEASVTNAGQATSSGATAEFFLDDPAAGGDPVRTAELPDLAPGEQAQVDATFTVNLPRGRARVHLVVRAPVGEDRDLANNTAFINVFVKTARNTYLGERDWPRPGGDVQRSGTTPNNLHPGVDPNPLWRVPATGQQIAAEGKVFFGAGRALTAVDAKTGTQAWSGDLALHDDPNLYRAPVYSRGWIYRAAPTSAGTVRARDGSYRFYATGGFGGSIPVFSIEVLPQEEGYDPVFSYRAAWGSINWGSGENLRCRLSPQRDVSEASGQWSDPLWEGTISSPLGNPGAGSMLLNHQCDGLPLSFASDDDRAFVTNASHLSAFNPRTGVGANGEPGTPFFSVRVPDINRIPAAPLVDSLGQVIVAGHEGTPWVKPTQTGTQTGKGRVVAASPTNGSTYWSFQTDTRLDGTPVEYKGTVVVVDRSGKVYALDQITGALKWSWKPTGYEPPAVDQQGLAGQTLALSRHYLYVPHPDGRLYTLDARDGTELSGTMFEARPYDLAIDDTNNAIYVRTLDGKLGAYPTREIPDQCAPDPANPAPAPGDIERVSFMPDGSQIAAGIAQERPAISGDGRVVAFARGGIESPFFSQLLVRDLATGATEALPIVENVTADIGRFNHHAPTLSGDGRYLAYIARQRNNRTGEDTRMMFVRDRQTGVTEPVLKKADGTAQYNIFTINEGARDGTSDSQPISMSDDGRYIAFATGTNSVVPGDTDGQPDVFVVDRVTNERRIISLTSDGQHVPNQSTNPSISSDGRYVTFTAMGSLTGTPVAPGENPFAFLVYRYDLATGRLDPVSVTGQGTLTTGTAPDISGDGRFITFSSGSDAFIPPAWLVWPHEAGRGVHAFVWDSQTGDVELATLNDVGEPPDNLWSVRPVISDDGRHVAFYSQSNTWFFLKGHTVDEHAQVFSRDLIAGRTEQVSHTRWGVSGLGSSQLPAMSGDGDRVAFVSTADDLAEGDTNNARDLFVYERSSAAGGDESSTGPTAGGGVATCPGDVDDESYSDLSVDADAIQPTALEQGQSGQVEVTVRNGGGVPSEATTVRLYDGAPGQGTLIGEQALVELAAGGETKLSFTWDPVAAAGAHSLTVVVDPERLVFEQNVVNNEAAKAAVVVAPRLDLALDADKDAYSADETVELAARIANGSLAERNVRAVVSIRDEDGSEVASVHDGQVRLDANGEATVPGEWNTLDTTPGRYAATARLLNAVGDELAAAERSFEIEPHVDAGLSLQTDELSYGPEETATIGTLVSNRSKNAPLTGALVELSLSEPDGDSAGSWNLPAGELMQGRTALLNQDKSLRGLDPGTYEANAKLLAADGTELARATTDFTLRSSADTGDGVRGSLTANPANPYRFTTASFAYSLTNAGNADIDGATVRVRVSDLTSGDTLKTLDEQRTITREGTNSGSLATRADMAENRDYQASLHLVMPDGSERPLDRAIIHVRPVPFTYGASFDTSVANRVLVWACEPADGVAARAALGDTFATYVAGCGSEEQRRFMRLVRGGDHNQFWILGDHHPIERGMGDELGARVIQGDGLLVAGSKAGHDLNLGGNRSPFGATHAGSLPPGTHTLQFAAGSAFAGLDAQVSGAPARLTTTQATGIATTSWGTAGNRRTAISATYNQFGRGKAIYVGAAPSEFADRSKASAVLAEAARVMLPPSDVTRAAGLTRLKLFVEGVAPGSPLEMRTQLPAGTGVPQVPSDSTLVGDLLTLPFDAEGTQRKDRAVWLKLPTGAPSVTTSSQVFYDDAGEIKPYGDPATATLDIAESKQTARDAALTALGQIGGADPAKMQKIRDDVAAAGGGEANDLAVLFSRLRALLDDIGTLERSRWTNTASAWMAIARLVTYVEYEHYRAGGN